MPELPEVRTVASALKLRVLGKPIASVEVYREKNILGDAKDFVFALRGKTIQDIRTKGKYLLFVFDAPLCMVSHLRMEGHYSVRATCQAKEKHELFAFFFADGTKLSYIDTRKFGRVELLDEDELSAYPPLAKLGPEPFDAETEYFYAGLQARHCPIKEALLDQTLLAGLGNIYADETLFASRIHPKTFADACSKEEASLLLHNAQSVLAHAIACGGSTIHSFQSEDGVSGRFQIELQAYGKGGLPCPRCGTLLSKTTVGGRGTTFCPRCQRKKGQPFVLGVTGPIHAGKSSVSSYLASKGYLVFDADQAVKELYKRKSVLADMKKILGRQSNAKGQINAPFIRDLFAKDKAKKKAWEAYLDPLLCKMAEEKIQACHAGQNIVFDVPRLVESHLKEYCDAILLVIASETLRARRIESEGRDVKSLMALNASYPLNATKKEANFVLVNNGDLPSLHEALDELPLQ